MAPSLNVYALICWCTKAKVLVLTVIKLKQNSNFRSLNNKKAPPQPPSLEIQVFTTITLLHGMGHEILLKCQKDLS